MAFKASFIWADQQIQFEKSHSGTFRRVLSIQGMGGFCSVSSDFWKEFRNNPRSLPQEVVTSGFVGN
jgi:hypothetical protein